MFMCCGMTSERAGGVTSEVGARKLAALILHAYIMVIRYKGHIMVIRYKGHIMAIRSRAEIGVI